MTTYLFIAMSSVSSLPCSFTPLCNVYRLHPSSFLHTFLIPIWEEQSLQTQSMRKTLEYETFMVIFIRHDFLVIYFQNGKNAIYSQTLSLGTKR